MNRLILQGQGEGLGGCGGLVPVLRRHLIHLGFVTQTDHIRTRTGTRPPHPLHSAPCPYRILQIKNGKLSPIRLSKITGIRTPCCMIRTA